MIEQIARALCEADWGVWRPELADHYTKRAQAILPLIEAAVLAERERCAGVAEWINPASTDYQRGRSDAAAKIRSQP